MSNKFKSKKAKLQKKSSSSGSLIAIIIVVIGVVAIGGYIILGGGGGSASSYEGSKYIGRYLPQGYEAPKVSEAQNYTSPIEMVDVKNTIKNGNLEISLKDIIENKFILTKYEQKKVESSIGQIGLPIMAYVRPSGKIFVAVSFCPPCRGVKHTIALDGTRVCNTCQTRTDLETDVGVKGSGPCWRYPQDELPVKITGDKVLIAENVLNQWEAQPLDRQISPQ